MRFATSSVRMLKAATGVLLLWLLSAPIADAAPSARRAAAGSVCDAQTLTLKKLRRLPKTFGGPLKRLARRNIAPLSDLTSRLLRGTRAQLDDDAAIQNDAPAASIDDAEQAVPALRPLGVLHGLHDQHLCSGRCSPRSPRGPPPHS